MAYSEQIFTDAEFGEVKLRKSSRYRKITIGVNKKGEVRISAPYFVSAKKAISFFVSSREWVAEALEKCRKRMDEKPSLSEYDIAMMREEAAAVLPKRLAELAGEYGFSYNAVRLKHNSSNWGSCSAKKNINLNISLIRLPDELRDYVMLHELCHLKHMNHGPEFHALLESVCPDHLGKKRVLRNYSIV